MNFIFATGVIHPHDSRDFTLETNDGKKQKVKTLLSRCIFKLIPKEDILADRNVLQRLFVSAFKSPRTSGSSMRLDMSMVSIVTILRT